MTANVSLILRNIIIKLNESLYVFANIGQIRELILIQITDDIIQITGDQYLSGLLSHRLPKQILRHPKQKAC